MFDEVLNKCAENNNYTIYTSMCKAQRILMRSYDPVCSISGGSDSDIVLDLIHKVDEDGKVKYFWIDTGLEYSATKEHLDYLEQKYGITIERVKPDKPIPNCVKQYGIPFLSCCRDTLGVRRLCNGGAESDTLMRTVFRKSADFLSIATVS